jgi:hypothetical protein
MVSEIVETVKANASNKWTIRFWLIICFVAVWRVFSAINTINSTEETIKAMAQEVKQLRQDVYDIKTFGHPK